MFSCMFILSLFIILINTLWLLEAQSQFWTKNTVLKSTNIGSDEFTSSQAMIKTAIEISVALNGNSNNFCIVEIISDLCNEAKDVSEYIISLVTPLCLGKDVHFQLLQYNIMSPFGIRITTCNEMVNHQILYLVPISGVFIWPSIEIGHKTSLHSLSWSIGRSVELETISESPRVFQITNLFSHEESQKLSHLYAESPKNADLNCNLSVNDANSNITKIFRQRVLDILSVVPYDEMMFEGVKIMSFEHGKYYPPHVDYFDHQYFSKEWKHSWDPIQGGTNRIATILFFMNDDPNGGEIVFPQASNFKNLYMNRNQTLQKTNNNTSNMLRNLEADCIARLSVHAQKMDVLLIYNQLPNGQIDPSSQYSHCPSSIENKQVAGMWVWNGPRLGFWKRNAISGELERPTNIAVSATFESEIENSSLFWNNQFWAKLQVGRSVTVNTFPGHEWNIFVDNKKVKSWIIEKNNPFQRYYLYSS